MLEKFSNTGSGINETLMDLKTCIIMHTGFFISVIIRFINPLFIDIKKA